MKIAVDAMGGDFAPYEIVKGAMLAASNLPDVKIILVGDEEAIKNVEGFNLLPNMSIVHVKGVITFNDDPVTRSQENSISVCCNLVKNNEADAYVSAGHTGACMASAVISWKKINKIDRPAIPTPIPTPFGTVVLIDAGANVDCKPINLHQFAIMGALYSEKIFGYKNPRIGLLSNGTEERKGNKLTLETFTLLKNSKLNFIGNVEGSSIFKNICDVIVCDGFTGNVMLKSIEASCEMVMGIVKEVINKTLTVHGSGKSLENFINEITLVRKKFDYAEYGGAPLLGVRGTCIIAHGSSKALAIKNAINVAIKFVEQKINDAIEKDIDLLF